jgi:hypothetical protein
MTLFPIIAIASVALILALIAGRLFVLVRPRLTVATAVLFAAAVCLGGVCYFGALSTYAGGGGPARAGLLLRDVRYKGLLLSAGLTFFIGALGLILLVAQTVMGRTTSR